MFHSLFRRNSEKLIIAWVTKLDLLLGMNAPIIMAINHLTRDPDLSRLKAVTNDIGGLLMSGWSLSEALAKHTKTFGSLHLYVATAEITGTLGTAIKQIATTYIQLHTIAVPISVSYNPENEDTFGCSMTGTSPAIEQANELCMSLFNGELSTPGRSVVVEQSVNLCEYSCVVYAVGDGVAKKIKDLSAPHHNLWATTGSGSAPRLW